MFNHSSATSSDLRKHVFSCYISLGFLTSQDAAQERDTQPMFQPVLGWLMDSKRLLGCHLQPLPCTEHRPSTMRAEMCRMSAVHRGDGKCITEP